jgi:mycothiol synthase
MAASTYTNRPFEGDHDLQAMNDLVSCRPPQRMMAFPSIVDLQEISGTQEGQEAFHLWHSGEKLAAFAYLSGDFLAFEVLSGEPFEPLAEHILGWAVEQLAATDEPPESIFTGCREEDTPRTGFLQQRGFTADPVRTIHFTRSLTDPIPAPVLPEGFSIRPLAGDTEVDAWLAVHHAAHESAQMTAEFRRSMMRAAEYCPELDLVVLAPDGRLAAYVMCHFSGEENHLRKQNVGYTDPVATHPNFQGKGLARALLLEGFLRLKAAGMEIAEVSTSADNMGMVRTAESVGYRQASTTIFFAKPLPKKQSEISK